MRVFFGKFCGWGGIQCEGVAMGQRGPKRQGKASSRRKGSSRTDRDQVLEVATELPQPPEELDESGADLFSDLATLLHEQGMVTTLDRHTLALYVNTLIDYRKARSEVDTYGITCVSDKGGFYQHPSVGVMNAAAARLKSLGRELGLTPAARSGFMPQQKTDDDDPLSGAEGSRATVST